MKEIEYNKFKKIKTAVILLCMFIAGICYSCSRFSKADDISEEAVTQAEINETLSDMAKPYTKTDESTQETCYVYVCGEVCSPGVYTLNEKSRIYEAVEMAGGFTEYALDDYINLADTVSDGMKLYVPDKSETGLYGNDTENIDSAKININTATKEQLMTLTGIGASRAEDIISYRESNGTFSDIEDIMKIPGIKESVFQKIKDNITI